MTEVNLNTEKIVVVQMIGLPENETILNYVDQVDRDKVTIYRTLGGKVQGYLVRQDAIDELENNGVQVILPREYYQIVENGTS
tara:strand:+ start:4216 stop:4464 length:249 start_codon:yes stop_codon:yes gene_type:complete